MTQESLAQAGDWSRKTRCGLQTLWPRQYEVNCFKYSLTIRKPYLKVRQKELIYDHCHPYHQRPDHNPC